MNSFSSLAESDIRIVFEAVRLIAARWSELFTYLGLKPSAVDEIRHDHPNSAMECLWQGLHKWLQRHYNDDNYSHPCWKQLIAAVSKVNCTLAIRLASQHSGMLNKSL